MSEKEQQCIQNLNQCLNQLSNEDNKIYGDAFVVMLDLKRGRHLTDKELIDKALTLKSEQIKVLQRALPIYVRLSSEVPDFQLASRIIGSVSEIVKLIFCNFADVVEN